MIAPPYPTDPAPAAPPAPGSAGFETGQLLGIPVVRAALELPDGSGHDPEKLAAVLAELP
jgi:hypothetical protein